MSVKRSGWTFFFQIALVCLVSVLAPLIVSLGIDLTSIWLSVGLTQSLMLIPVLVAALLAPARMSEIFPFRKFHPLSILLCMMISMMMLPSVAFLNLLTLLFFQSGTAALQVEMGNYPLWSMVLLVGILGPFCEEFAFRGFHFQNLKASGRILGAMVLSAIFFGLMHMNFNQAAYAILLGLVAAMAVEATGSLWAGFIIHATFNTEQVLMNYVVTTLSESMGGAMDSAAALDTLLEGGTVELILVLAVYFVLGAALLVGVFFLMKLMAKLEGRSFFAGKKGVAPEEAPVVKRSVLSVGAVLGILGALGYMVATEIMMAMM